MPQSSQRRRPMLRASVLAAALAGFVAWPAVAQNVLKSRDVSESALIEALSPEPEVRTRSIRVQPNASGQPAAPVASAKKNEASLLITFETNSAQLTPQAKTLLDKVGRALKSDQLAEFEFSIEGHADPRGDTDNNQRLSQARAESVVAYLVEAHSLPGGRLHARGKGDRELMNASHPDAPENRRVTIKTVVK